jgi:VanZ family protein
MSAGARFLRYWLPPLLWAMVIFSASTSAGSAEHTSRFFKPLLRWLLPGLSEVRLDQAHLLVRKSAHAAEYAVLAALLLRALRPPMRGRTPPWRRADAIWAVVMAAAIAAADETFQSFWIERLGSPVDVGIDALGALVAVTLYWGTGRRAGRW